MNPLLAFAAPALLAGLQSPGGGARQDLAPGRDGHRPPSIRRQEPPERGEEQDEWEEDHERRDQMKHLLPDQAERRALLQANGLLPAPGASLGPPMAQSGGWEGIGPRGAMDLRGGNGRLEDIQFVDSYPASYEVDVFVAGNCGVWRTRLSTWTEWVDLSAGLPTYGVGAINVDPNDPDWIIAGTGCRYAEGQGIYVRKPNPDDPAGPFIWWQSSIKAWDEEKKEYKEILPPRFIWRIARAGGSTLVAATELGLLRSEDNGVNWKRVLDETNAGNAGGFSDVIVDPSNPSTLWACEYNPADRPAPGGGTITVSGEIWRSTNAGIEWDRLPHSTLYAGIPVSEEEHSSPCNGRWARAKLAVCRTQPDHVTVLAACSGGWARAYRSTNARDAAPSWSDVSGVGNGKGKFNDAWTLGGQPYNNMCIAIDPLDPEVMHAGMVHYWKRDASGSWASMGGAQSGHIGGHADFTAMRFSPAVGLPTRDLFITSDGGAYQLDTVANDTYYLGGDQVTGISSTTAWELIADRQNIWITLQDNGLMGPSDGGATWFQVKDADGGSLDFTDPVNNDIAYSAGTLYKTYHRKGDGTSATLDPEQVGWFPSPSHHHRSDRFLFSKKSSTPLSLWDASVDPPSLVTTLGSLHSDVMADPASLTIASPGSGYEVGELLTASGGTSRGVELRVRVTGVDSLGAATSCSVHDNRAYSTPPANPVTLIDTSGSSSGSGLTVDLDWNTYFPLPTPAVSPVEDLIHAYVHFSSRTWGSDYPQGRDLVVLKENGDGTWAKYLHRDVIPSGNIFRISPSRMWSDEAWFCAVGTSAGQPKVFHFRDFDTPSVTDISGNLITAAGNVYDVISVPFQPNRLFAATDLGVFHTTDGGSSWSLEPGIPRVLIHDLDLTITPHGPAVVYAASHSQGVFRSVLSTPPVVFVDHSATGALEDGTFESPFRTVSAGLAAAPDGAILAVRSGTYKAPILADRSVTIISWAGSTLVR